MEGKFIATLTSYINVDGHRDGGEDKVNQGREEHNPLESDILQSSIPFLLLQPIIFFSTDQGEQRWGGGRCLFLLRIHEQHVDGQTYQGDDGVDDQVCWNPSPTM